MATLHWADLEVRLLAGRGAFLPEHGALLVADTHFGKARVFAQAGIPVPGATTAATLERVQRMLHVTRAGTLIILGDLWHGRVPAEDASFQELAAWRDRNQALVIHVIKGNHDRFAEGIGLRDVKVHDEYLEWGSIRFQHHPEEQSDRFVLAGHVHPVVTLHDVGQTTMRLPCFHVQERVITLPAIGAFTGGGRVDPSPGDRLFVCGDDEVFELPPV